MGRESTEKRRARENKRYAEDPEYRAKIKAQRRAYYLANREKIKARTKAYRAANPRWQWAHNVKQYGITLEEWDAMLVSQSGRCAICSDFMRSPHVDHDHQTGAVRGLLCSPCNTGLGHFKDDVDRLASAVQYLNVTGTGSVLPTPAP